MASRKRIVSEPPKNRLIWRAHSTGPGAYTRVWIEGWPGDIFELLSSDEFAILRHSITILERFSPNMVILVEADDDA